MASAPAPAPSAFEGGADFDWEKYIAHRPDYNLSDFYSRIWTYHSKHSDNWTLAHDVGTGPGNVADILKGRFSKVVASDASNFHVEVARKRINSPNVTMVQCRGEDLLEVAGAGQQGKVDLITLAECLPLMDAEKAFVDFGKLLRPGGTLAAWFYGRPIFEGTGQEKSQEIYNKITAKAFERLYPIKGSPIEPASTMLASWLDNVAFPPNTWSDIERVKWNHDKDLLFFETKFLDYDVKYQSQVHAGEKVEECIDRGFWAKEDCGVDWVKGFTDAQFPWKNEDESTEKQLEPMYEALEEAMGGKGSKVTIAWPVILLLATKK